MFGFNKDGFAWKSHFNEQWWPKISTLNFLNPGLLLTVVMKIQAKDLLADLGSLQNQINNTEVTLHAYLSNKTAPLWVGWLSLINR